jgi:cytoskeletal protein CcmA (bactofilin family)
MSSTLSASGIYDSGTLTVLGNTVLGDALTDTLQVTGSVSLTGSFSVVGSITGSSLSVTGNSTLTTITGALSGSSVSTGNATINGGNINNTVIGGTTPAAGTFTNLTATGNTLLGDALSDSVKVTGSFSISGSLSVVGSITGTIETASKVAVTNLPSADATYYVAFVENTGSAQSILTDSNVLSYNPATNILTVGGSDTGSVVVGASSAFQVIKGTSNDKVSTSLPLTASAKVLFSNTSQATSWDNGALVVGGGVGIGKDLYVSGSTFLYGDLTIYGSSSIVNISSSTLIIGDNRILLNAGNPIIRYAGIDVYDSGSGGIQSNVTSSFLWDSLNDNWIIFSANSSSGTFTTASSIMIGGPVSKFGSEATLSANIIPKVQSSGKNIADSALSDNGTTLSYTGTGISASQITSSTITSSNAFLTNVYSTTISSSLISASNLRVQLTGSITYATGVLVTYITGSFNTLTLSTGSSPGNAPGLVPSAPTSIGMPGQINVDNNFIYVYTNNVWKRVPLSQWLN